ncbi:hypothetical protein Tco_1084815 [Tanacetum coccineum]
MVKSLLLDKKNQSPAPTPVKAVEESCVTCGGAHSYQTCPATTSNVYRDNIQEYVSQAAAANYNQGNTGDLKVMVEPDVESKVWRNLQGHKVTVWKLFSSEMLNKKLQVDHRNEMCYQLLKLMTKQLKNPGSV